MAFKLADLVKESGLCSGAGDISFSGAVIDAGFTYNTFASFLADGDTTFYFHTEGALFEIGLGTYNLAQDSIARTLVFASSNNGQPVNFTAAAGVTVCNFPAAQIMTKDEVVAAIAALTKADLALDQVDNTSDVNKDISNATAAALATKATLPELVSFSTAISLTATKYSAITPTVGPLAFTLGVGAVEGGSYRTLLISDGTNIPTFSSDFAEVVSSSGYDNTASVGNHLQVEYMNGKALYAFTQEVGDVGQIYDIIPPVLQSVTVENAEPTKVVLTFDELDQTTVLIAGDFAVSGHTVSAATIVSATVIELTVDAFVNGEPSRTVGYIKSASVVNRIKDDDGNETETFSGVSITNNVAAPLAYLRFNTLSGPNVETPTANGYEYVASGGGVFWSGASLKLPADGQVELEINLAGSSPLIFLSSTSTNTTWGSSEFGIYITGNQHRLIDAGVLGATNLAFSQNELLRFTRVGTTTTVDRSTDGGANYDAIGTFTNEYAGDLYLGGASGNGDITLTDPTIMGGVAP